MKKIIFIGIIVTVILAGSFSCKRIKNPVEPNDSEYIVFGDFYGECTGPDCVQIYKIDKGILYHDTTHIYPQKLDFYKGKWEKMPDSKQKLINSLIFNFPLQLFSDTGKVFGMPDAYDQGGIYLETNQNNSSIGKFWLIDRDPKNLPEYLKDFVMQLRANIMLMRK